MRRKGAISVVVLWILLALTTISFSSLAMAKRRQDMGHLHKLNTHVLYLAVAGNRWAQSMDFKFDEKTFVFKNGTVRVSLREGRSPRELTLKTRVQTSGLNKTIETKWEKRGRLWRALTWNEYAE